MFLEAETALTMSATSRRGDLIESASKPGQIIVLNGVPRSGKSSIAAVMMERFEGPWLNLGVDNFKRHIISQRYSPGIGLKPGGVCPDLEPWVALFFAAMYESIAVHSRNWNCQGLAGAHSASVWRASPLQPSPQGQTCRHVALPCRPLVTQSVADRWGRRPIRRGGVSFRGCWCAWRRRRGSGWSP